MSMVKRANGQVESFTDEQGKEVKADNLVWADEKDKKDPEIKDSLDIPVINDLTLDINATDEDDSVIAKDC